MRRQELAQIHPQRSFLFGCCGGPKVAEANGYARGASMSNADIMISELGDSQMGLRRSTMPNSTYERTLSCPAEHCDFVCETADQLFTHQSSCVFISVHCPHCRQHVRRMFIRTHEMFDCNSVMQCGDCQMIVGNYTVGAQRQHDCEKALSGYLRRLE